MFMYYKPAADGVVFGTSFRDHVIEVTAREAEELLKSDQWREAEPADVELARARHEAIIAATDDVEAERFTVAAQVTPVQRVEGADTVKTAPAGTDDADNSADTAAAEASSDEAATSQSTGKPKKTPDK